MTWFSSILPGERKEITEWAKIFHELGLDRKGDNAKTSLFLSPTFLRYGAVKGREEG